MITRSRDRVKDTQTSSDFTPEFFKIFLPQFSAQQLRIPQAFIRQFKRTIQKKLVLKDQGGKLWNVEVNETVDGVFITKGWQNFVKQHALNPGDFLVFRCDGKFSFTVKIFGTNGCKKEFVASENIVTRIKIEDETEEHEAEQTCPERTHKVEPNFTEQSQKRPDKLSGSRKVKQSRLRRRSSRVDTRMRSSEAVGVAEPGVPYLIASVNSLHRYKVLIPKIMVTKYDVKFKPEMILCNHKGSWPVSVRWQKDDHLAFGKGWMTFGKENNLHIGDRCMFTFDNASGSGKIEVQVLPNSCKRQHRSR